MPTEDDNLDHEFLVRATPLRNGHELHIVGVGTTQTDDDNDADAEEVVRDYLESTFERPGNRFRVRIEYSRRARSADAADSADD